MTTNDKPLITLDELKARVEANKATLATAAKLRIDARAGVTKAKTVDARTEAQQAAIEANAAAARMEAEIEWRPEYLVAHFQRWECACGGKGCTPLGLFVRYQHGRFERTIRDMHEIRGLTNFNYLPRRVKYEDKVVPVCDNCADILHNFKVVL